MEWRAKHEVTKFHCAGDDDNKCRQPAGSIYKWNIIYGIQSEGFQSQKNKSNSGRRIHGNAWWDDTLKKVDIPSPANKRQYAGDYR